MTVYGDNARHPYGRMLMCHMLADTEHELHAMARSIGIARRWYQNDHYDICLEKRAVAVRLGAKEVSSRELVLLRRVHRRPHSGQDGILPRRQSSGESQSSRQSELCPFSRLSTGPES